MSQYFTVKKMNLTPALIEDVRNFLLLLSLLINVVIFFSDIFDAMCLIKHSAGELIIQQGRFK